ncbi:MAG: tryptophan 2,3-dioxygenase family protein [Cyclobacteriaceae bacterium]|nr:tryptophan 2,3-dioxygenase family protein [Cyclobacteriaceae bacterium]
MTKKKIDENILNQVEKLEKKYAAMGQDLSSYLDGLLYADYLTYWDYIHLDTLLTLQTPKTPFPDEMIFIMYHQITELYFRMILFEINSIAENNEISSDEFLKKIGRINRYLQNLESSFDIMIDGMDRDQFLKFRMSLLPSSGFQSAQYRIIELSCTHIENLLSEEHRKASGENVDLESSINALYWKQGATELATGKKTLTLKQFEDKYHDEFVKTALKFKDKNLAVIYKNRFAKKDENGKIKESLRELDVRTNVSWRLAHYKSAVRYLQKDPEDIKATGGTNWQKYLPPRFQRVIFFPELWSEQEISDWGKNWVVKEVFG